MFTFQDAAKPSRAFPAARTISRAILLAGLALPLIPFVQQHANSDAAPAPAPAGPVVGAKPTAPPPLPADPTETNPFNGGRGGLMDAVNGQDAGCTGVLCNFMGGERAPPPPGAPRMNRTQAELDAIDAAPAHPVARRRSDGSYEPPPEKRCVDTADPWKCYR